jgi:hypothetical protein
VPGASAAAALATVATPTTATMGTRKGKPSKLVMEHSPFSFTEAKTPPKISPFFGSS